MDRRKRKQFAYGAIFLTILVVFLAGFYFIFVHQPPSCFDNQRNQGEEGIDCGGPCSELCVLPGTPPIKLLGKVKALYADQGNSTIVVQIQGTATGFAAKSFDYTVRLYDASGGLLTELSGASSLYERELKYLLFPNIIVPVEEVERADVTFARPDWVAATNFPRPNVFVRDTHTSDEAAHIESTGNVTNGETESVRDVRIVTLLYGRLGELASASQTQLDMLDAGETRSFTVLHPRMGNVDFAATQVFVFAEWP